jgi:hypothetical protein
MADSAIISASLISERGFLNFPSTPTKADLPAREFEV